MAVFIIPECPECKTAKHVVWKVADVKDLQTWFDIIYCTNCYTVIQCYFRGRVLKKGEHSLTELKKRYPKKYQHGN